MVHPRPLHHHFRRTQVALSCSACVPVLRACDIAGAEQGISWHVPGKRVRLLVPWPLYISILFCSSVECVGVCVCMLVQWCMGNGSNAGSGCIDPRTWCRTAPLQCVLPHQPVCPRVYASRCFPGCSFLVHLQFWLLSDKGLPFVSAWQTLLSVTNRSVCMAGTPASVDALPALISGPDAASKGLLLTLAWAFECHVAFSTTIACWCACARLRYCRQAQGFQLGTKMRRQCAVGWHLSGTCARCIGPHPS